MNAIVFFDLDGTLLNKNKKIEPSSIKAIRKLKHENILPVIATGRNIVLVRDIMRQSGINSAICGNGNFIILNKHPIFKSIIPPSILAKFVSKARLLHDPITFQSAHNIAMSGKNKLTIHEYNEKHHTDPIVDKKFPLHHEIIGCNVFTLKNDKIYKKAFSNQLDIVRNSDMCLDVQNKGINKGTGVKKIMQKLHAKKVPSFAFGDGLNDVPMLHQATYGICMRNGYTATKNASDYITNDNNHNGIWNGLRHFGLI